MHEAQQPCERELSQCLRHPGFANEHVFQVMAMQLCPNPGLGAAPLLGAAPCWGQGRGEATRSHRSCCDPSLSPASVAVPLLEHTAGPGTATNAALLQDFANS